MASSLRWHSPPLSSLINSKNCGSRNNVQLPITFTPHFELTGTLFICKPQQSKNGLVISCYPSETTTYYTTSESGMESEEELDDEESPASPSTTSSNGGMNPPPILKKKKRYRKAYPGENKGIAEEMRFVAMKLRNKKFVSDMSDQVKEDDDGGLRGKGSGDQDSESENWEPSMEGFAKFLVDSKLVFQTLEGIVEESDDVAYTYFRKTGLERSERLAKDIEWLRQTGVKIPEPSKPGISYSTYLKELAEKSSPLFLSHFYNMYFAHISGGQVIVKQVSDKLLDGRELEFCRWDRAAQELLKDVRNNLNQLADHWSRDDKNRCLREATKSFRYMGQIVRLIIL